ARLLPVAAETFSLLHALRGSDAIFRSRDQAAAVQTIISNPGDSHLVVLPTGGGKSDLVFLSSMYERRRSRVTLLVLPFVALKYDLEDRGKALGLNIVRWSSMLTKESIATVDILLLSVENLDSGRFRQQFTELLIGKQGNSLIARIFFDEAHTILGHFEFRPSFQAISDLTSLSIPIVLLSATIPPSKVNEIRRAYNRFDLRLIRAPTTMRRNIIYDVERVESHRLQETLNSHVEDFLINARPADRALIFCMSVSTTEELYSSFNGSNCLIYFYHGKLQENEKQDILRKWLNGEYMLLFCTSAFGVGIDYAEVSLVVHYDGIWSLMDFVQESGRAGRNRKPAQSLVLLRSRWSPNFSRMPASDAQEVVDYVNPEGLCRRLGLRDQYF
ncbi:P-loop containing nucleoside triphosphate hydrolase protein, partial [Lipomyces starkeyi]